MEKLTKDLNERDVELYIPTLYCNNLGGVDLMKDTKFHNKAKHIEIQYMFLRTDIVERNQLKVIHILGKD